MLKVMSWPDVENELTLPMVAARAEPDLAEAAQRAVPGIRQHAVVTGRPVREAPHGLVMVGHLPLHVAEVLAHGGGPVGVADRGKAVGVGIDDHAALARPVLADRRSSMTSRAGVRDIDNLRRIHSN